MKKADFINVVNNRPDDLYIVFKLIRVDPLSVKTPFEQHKGHSYITKQSLTLRPLWAPVDPHISVSCWHINDLYEDLHSTLELSCSSVRFVKYMTADELKNYYIFELARWKKELSFAILKKTAYDLAFKREIARWSKLRWSKL